MKYRYILSVGTLYIHCYLLHSMHCYLLPIFIAICYQFKHCFLVYSGITICYPQHIVTSYHSTHYNLLLLCIATSFYESLPNNTIHCFSLCIVIYFLSVNSYLQPLCDLLLAINLYIATCYSLYIAFFPTLCLGTCYHFHTYT